MRFAGRTGTDTLAALVTCLSGLFVIWEAWGYRLGTARDMGPGYFPTMAGIALILTGVGIFLIEGRGGRQHIRENVPVRPIVMIVASIVAFALLIEPLGFMATAFISLLLAALADRQSGAVYCVLLSAGITVVSFVIFSVLLDLQLPAFWW